MNNPRTTTTPQQAGQRRAGIHSLAADDGAATAEYVIATMAAVGLAGLLVAILRGDAVKEILMDLVRTALSVAG